MKKAAQIAALKFNQGFCLKCLLSMNVNQLYHTVSKNLPPERQVNIWL